MLCTPRGHNSPFAEELIIDVTFEAVQNLVNQTQVIEQAKSIRIFGSERLIALRCILKGVL